uniref:Peptidase A1 domain-containing protein n=1 Tax=Kalanchoe fedtschenkoi TaxID=63787 RepID=A0A7N1A933_KALFE
MAGSSAVLLLFSFLLLHTAHSRTLGRKTQTLDVSSSLRSASAILSFHPKSSLQHQHSLSAHPTFPNSTSRSFSIPIHPREAVQHSKPESYRSLVLARLERDAARVDSLNSKLELALQEVKKSDLMPETGGEFRVEDLSAPVTSGISKGSGEYFARMGVGSPPQQMYMVIDTGSDVSWLQCAPCVDCYSQTDPVFDPATSSSYAPVACDAPLCRALDNAACSGSGCQYQVNYGDGSFTVGDLVTETLSFGSSGAVQKIAVGCGHDNEGLFTGSDGLIGLGGGALSLPTQIQATSFSYCLVDRNSPSSSSLEFNAGLPSNSITAPLIKNQKIDTFLYVSVVGMSVGGRKLSLPPSLFTIDESSGRGGIIIDSGTAVTRLKTEVYDALRDSFRSAATELPPPNSGGIALFDTCYDLSGLSSVRVPTVAFELAGGKSLRLPAKNYLIPLDTSGTYCFAFAGTSSALSIIGNVQQQSIRVAYDLGNKVVGFAPNSC